MHTPVLLHEVVDALEVKPGNTFLDCTLGDGGHALAIARAAGDTVKIIGIDANEKAIARARERLATVNSSLCAWHGNFRHLERALAHCGATGADAILFDLGVSTYELLESGRGFSFSRDEPLQMTFGAPREGGLIARDVVNHWSEESLTSIFSGFGEERYAKALARAIVDARTHAPIETSGALARIIERALPRRGKIHPATRIFQAIRIAVNDEFGALHEALPKALAVLAPSRRLAVISFHSGEDRIVKNIFRAAAARGEGEASKKPIIPTRVEITENARARSAKLRLFIKK